MTTVLHTDCLCCEHGHLYKQFINTPSVCMHNMINYLHPHNYIVCVCVCVCVRICACVHAYVCVMGGPVCVHVYLYFCHICSFFLMVRPPILVNLWYTCFLPVIMGYRPSLGEFPWSHILAHSSEHVLVNVKIWFTSSILGGLDGGVPNSVFNNKNCAYSWFDKWNITLLIQ